MQFQPRSLSLGAAPSASACPPSPESNASILFIGRWLAHLTLAALLFLLLTLVSGAIARAQDSSAITPTDNTAQNATPTGPLPFDVSNPKHKKWPEAEATRIYTWACDLLARTVHPERPPQLRPKFRLVLGADNDEFFRDGPNTEIHLKSWNSEKFAQGVVVIALRELVPRPDLAWLAHESVSMAGSTVDVIDLQHQ